MSDQSELLTELVDLAHASLNLGDESLDGIVIPREAEKKILLGVLIKQAEFISGILALCDGSHSGPISSLARSVMEGYVTASYIFGADSGERAKAYVAKATLGNKRFYERILRVANSSPAEGSEFIEMLAVGTSVELEERLAEIDEEISGSGRFPTTVECARALGPRFELLYAQVYGHIWSDDVHFGPRTVLRPLFREETPPERLDHCVRILISVIDMYHDLLRLATMHLGVVDAETLETLSSRLSSIRGTLEAAPG